MTKHEVLFLQNRNSLLRSKQSFEHEPIGKIPPIIKSLGSNTPIQQELYQQYKSIAEQTRKNIIDLTMDYAQVQMKEYQRKFDILTKEIWDEEKNLPLNQQLNSTMHRLIEERLRNITRHVEYFYNLKIQLFHAQIK